MPTVFVYISSVKVLISSSILEISLSRGCKVASFPSIQLSKSVSAFAFCQDPVFKFTISAQFIWIKILPEVLFASVYSILSSRSSSSTSFSIILTSRTPSQSVFYTSLLLVVVYLVSIASILSAITSILSVSVQIFSTKLWSKASTLSIFFSTFLLHSNKGFSTPGSTQFSVGLGMSQLKNGSFQMSLMYSVLMAEVILTA